MPPVVAAAAITGAIGIFGMVNQNAQNKAAQKNNQNQQQGAVDNANNALQQATNNLAPAMAPVQGSVGPAPAGPKPGIATSTPTTGVTPPMITPQQVMGGGPPPTIPNAPTPQQLAAAQAVAAQVAGAQQRVPQPIARSAPPNI